VLRDRRPERFLDAPPDLRGFDSVAPERQLDEAERALVQADERSRTPIVLPVAGLGGDVAQRLGELDLQEADRLGADAVRHRP
jgi:hypothetical protein